MLQSRLCDYNNAYIVVKGTINVADPPLYKKSYFTSPEISWKAQNDK